MKTSIDKILILVSNLEDVDSEGWDKQEIYEEIALKAANVLDNRFNLGE